jgi:hypothetical protein
MTDKRDGWAGKMRRMVFDVVQTIEVVIDESKMGAEFWDDFNKSITDRGGPDPDYICEHIAWNYAMGAERFVEGVGDLKEMNVRVREIESFIETADALSAREAG